MPDIQLRFHKDMLVLSAPVDAALARQGIDAARDRQYLNLMEPDSIRDALRLEAMAGAQCIVTTTEDITQARLAHLRMDADAVRLARAAVDAASGVKPQHVLVEIGPCGLPLDASSKASLNENRAQYAGAARAFEGIGFDAFFLNGFSSVTDLKCALMGVAQASDAPVFASVVLGEGLCQESRQSRFPGSGDLPGSSRRGALPKRHTFGIRAPAGPGSTGAQESAPTEVAVAGGRSLDDAALERLSAGGGAGEVLVYDMPFGAQLVAEEPALPFVPTAGGSGLDAGKWAEAVAAMVDLGAAVVGFETAEPIDRALEYVRVATGLTDRPVLAQLRVTAASAGSASKNLTPLADIDEYTPDTMATAAVKLYGAGVQFLRATGEATPAYTGALAATVMGLDARR